MKTITITNVDSVDLLPAVTGYTFHGDDTMEAHDGSHSFEELYQHRYRLFIALARILKSDDVSLLGVWRSHCHYEESFPMFPGYFLLGIGKDKGRQISYHLPVIHWGETDFAETLDRAPQFDGHTSFDVLERLKHL